MKKLFTNYNSFSLLKIFFVLFFAFNFTNANAQQVAGSNSNIDAGFESQSAGNLGTTATPPSTTSWSYVLSGNGQSRTIAATGGYGGPVFLTVGKTAGWSSNSSTTINSNAVASPTFIADRKYIVQFHYKANTANASTPDPTSFVFISADGTSGNRITTPIILATPASWTKFTSLVTTNNVTAQTATGTSGINIKATTTGTATLVDVDNFVVYPADNQTTPVPDIAAPNAPTSLTATGNPAVINLSWTAPASGVDGGGYMIVRFTSDPTVTIQPDPLQNAVYKANAANVIGTTGTVVYVGDVATTTFDDGTAVIGTNYWYRIYTVDKAFNYSSAANVVGPVASTPRVNYYYNGVGAADNATSWFANANFTGANPTNFSTAGQVYRITTNATLPATLNITGTGAFLMIGAPSPGVNAVTVNFNSTTLPAIDTLYQSSNGLPTVLNFNTSAVPSINQLFDVFTEVRYRAAGIAVSTSKTFDKIFVENNSDVIFNGSPTVTTSFNVAAGSTATIGTLSTRWLTINSPGTATINGTLKIPKLTGLVTSNIATSSAGGAIQFVGIEALTIGSTSTIEFSGISTTTTQTVTPRTDYANVTLSGVGITKTFTGATTIAGILTINTTGTGGNIVSAPVTVNGGLVLTAGNITTDATNFLTLGNTATLSGGSNSSYINGPLRRNTSAASGFIFPVGKGNLYRPVTITPQANSAATFQVENFNAAYSNIASVTAPLTAVSNAEYWDIQRSSGTTGATVALSLNGVAVPNATAANDLVVAQFATGSWQSLNATPITNGSSTTGTATSSSISSFGPFTFGIRSTTVPLNLIAFQAKLEGNNVLLNWTTTNEINVNRFEIERSENGNSFNNIATQLAKNNSYNTYSFADVNNATNSVWYRLKMIDNDGKSKYSNVLILKNKNKNSVVVFSNPIANKNIQLQLNSLESGNHLLAVCDLSGKMIAQKQITHAGNSSIQNIQLPISIMPGIYILKVLNEYIRIMVD